MTYSRDPSGLWRWSEFEEAWWESFRDRVNPWDGSDVPSTGLVDDILNYGTMAAQGTAVVATTAVAASYVGPSAVSFAGRVSLPYRVPPTVGVRVGRFFMTRTGYQQVVSQSYFRGAVSRIGWQWHHWAIPQAAARAAGNPGLTRISNAGWNLFPIPAGLNGSIGAGGAGFNIVRIAIGTSPIAAGAGGYAVGSAAADLIPDEADNE